MNNFYAPFSDPRNGVPFNQGIPNGMQYGNPVPKTPAPTIANIKSFIASQLQISEKLIEFVQLSEPFCNTGAPLRHACIFSLLAIEHFKSATLQFFDKATVEIAFCPYCFKVLFYVEKL